MITTAGDLIYGTAADTVARLGIGTAGQVLKVNSGATAPEWGTAAGGGANWSLLNSGGTALTGAATITVSGISNADKILILVFGASSANAGSAIGFRLNADSAANYDHFGAWLEFASTYAATNFSVNNNDAATEVPFMKTASNAASAASGFVLISGCNASGVKAFNCAGTANAGGGNGQINGQLGGVYVGTSVISSITLTSSTGNFDAGTVYVYTSA